MKNVVKGIYCTWVMSIILFMLFLFLKGIFILFRLNPDAFMNTIWVIVIITLVGGLIGWINSKLRK